MSDTIVRVRRGLLAVLLVLSAATSSGACSEIGEASKPEAEVPKTEAQPVPVQVTVATVGPISQTILATTTVKARHDAHIIAEATGSIAKVTVEEGGHVEARQLLAEISNPEVAISASTAAANVAKLKRELTELAPLVDKGFVARTSYDEAKHQLALANDQLAQVATQAKHLHVRSPIAGIVATRGVDPGRQVTPGLELFYVVDPSELEAVIHVPERNIGELRDGTRAYAVSDALGDVRFPGHIRLINPVVDPQTGTIKVTVAIDDPDPSGPRLRPGMFVSVYLITAQRDSAVVVPKRAVVYEDNTPYIFVATKTDGKASASKRAVELGFEQETMQEVTGGVSRGDLVIVIGQSGLKDETPVQITGEH